ncbi:MAG: hypothetical protein HQL23_02250 [Candidatus Omnitrophica bacterium]|nr:hypothetical protein [Candidatus Omnitrophota bacterium]
MLSLLYKIIEKSKNNYLFTGVFMLRFKKNVFYQCVAMVLVMLCVYSEGPVQNVLAQTSFLPAPGELITSTSAFVPVMMKGLIVHPENPLLFDFIIDSGMSGYKINSPAFKAESQKLIKYFLATLTIKEDDLWVNLSPYEKDRMIPTDLGQTEMGRDMLAQDYILKQLTASLMYPENELGKKFWDKVYAKVQKQYGNVDIPIDTFNKVWIVADRAKVMQIHNSAFVTGWRLKVMMEEDYTALEKSSGISRRAHTRYARHRDESAHALAAQAELTGSGAPPPFRSAQSMAAAAVKEIIIPEIEKEVNQGKNFAQLRQMFHAMILAAWYKKSLKNALINQVYSNKGKTGGVATADPKEKDKIYQKYVQTFQQGVFNYIKEDTDPITEETTQTLFGFASRVRTRYERI